MSAVRVFASGFLGFASGYLAGVTNALITESSAYAVQAQAFAAAVAGAVSFAFLETVSFRRAWLSAALAASFAPATYAVAIAAIEGSFTTPDDLMASCIAYAIVAAIFHLFICQNHKVLVDAIEKYMRSVL